MLLLPQGWAALLPWLRGWIGSRTGAHVDVVADQVWTALGQYVWSQAAVALLLIQVIARYVREQLVTGENPAGQETAPDRVKQEMLSKNKE